MSSDLEVKTAFGGATALVTGATGFLGRRLCASLAGRGARVVGVARRAVELHGVELVTCDLTDRGASDALVENSQPDFVFHLAGLVKGARDASLVLPALKANLLSTVHLLSALESTGCRRFVQAGSLEEPPLDAPAAVPSSPYAASKTAATAYCRMFAELYELPVTLARIFMVYGPGVQDTNKLVPYVALEQLRGRVPKISSGAREVDWVFVDDVVEGLERLALADGVVGRQVDLGCGTLHSVRAVAEAICQLGGQGISPEIGARENRAMEQVRLADVEATRDALGWAPSTSLEDGLLAALDWFSRSESQGGQPSD